MKLLLTISILFLGASVLAQTPKVYTITADSTKLTGCDSNELIIENHTQAIKGFLYNTGNGRTIFKKGWIQLNDSMFLIGSDTFHYNAWLQGGNRWGKTGILGTLDNNHLTFIANNTERMRLTNTGRLLMGTTTDNNANLLQVNGSIYGTYYTNFTPNPPANSGALRLRWGSGDGVYLGFYFQNSTNRRGYISSAADGRPLSLEDSVGFSFLRTPYISMGTEGAFSNSKLSIVKPYTQSMDIIGAGHSTNDTTWVLDMNLKANGNLLIGGGVDYGYKFQASKQGVVSLDPTLSRASDQIKIGGNLNSLDGQNILIATLGQSGGWKPMIVERDGNLGLGLNGRNWIVGTPPLRISSGGYVGVESQYMFFGSMGGPYNCSALYMYVSNTNEWTEGLGTYPNGQNYYFFGTRLGLPEGSNKRAPLKIGADQLIFTPGATDVEAARFSEAGYLGLGTTTPSAQLHTTGTVRFAGLTNDDTKTNVLVSDANGNLYYRTAASLADLDILHSSLAVAMPKDQKWPDYVFDSAYKLPDLQGTTEFALRYGHLPGVTSAEEVERKGIDLARHAAATLKKIEELTLYAADQDKRLKEQEAVINTQSADIQAMRKELDELKKIVATKVKN